MDSGQAVRVAAAIIIRNGRVLVCRRAEGERLAGFWEFPGGKLEAGESLCECLERELREELGVDARAGEEIGRSRYSYEHGEIELVGLMTELPSGEMNASGAELRLSVHDQLIWAAADELLALNLAPADIPLARKIVDDGLIL